MNFDVDYWGVAYRPLLKKIINQSDHETFSIYANFENWNSWQLPYLNHLLLFSADENQKIVSDLSESCSDYIIAAHHKAEQYSKDADFVEFDRLNIDGRTVYTTFKRIIPIFQEYSSLRRAPIEYSKQNSSCFTADWSGLKIRHENSGGWSSIHENWGVWSVDKKAVLTLLTPHYPVQALVLETRAFVGPKKEAQNISVSIDNQKPINFRLTNFDKNIIKIPIKNKLATNNSLIVVKFDLPDASSPKELGLSDDTRLLGIGLISSKFE